MTSVARCMLLGRDDGGRGMGEREGGSAKAGRARRRDQMGICLIGIAAIGAALMYRPHGTDSPPHVGHHAGLLPEETRVPLVIA